MAAYNDITVLTMADPIYGIHQSQPQDIYNFLKANAKKLDLVGRFSYLPNLIGKANRSVGMNDGIEMIITDEVSFLDEPMLDGRTRRYSRVKVFMASFGSFGLEEREAVADQVINAGYSDINVETEFDDGLSFRSVLGLPETYINPLLFTGGSLSYITAGVPRYIGDELSIMDAPHDGKEYVRADGEWILSDHFVHASVDGGEATV